VGDFSPEFKDLVNHMMAYDSNERLTLDQIKLHPWVTQTYDLPSVGEVQEQMAKLKK
jgi:serine/threonine protein kinase